MFNDQKLIKEIETLKLNNQRLSNDLDSAEEDNRKLDAFYKETQEVEMDRLKAVIVTLTKENDGMRNAKEAARMELQKEYSDRVKQIEDDYASKLQIETTSNANKIEFIEGQMTTEIDNRTNEAIAQIRLDNKEFKMENKHNKELMEIYKKKFEGGKIELGADEIKGMLLSANPNGQKIIETMNSTI